MAWRRVRSKRCCAQRCLLPLYPFGLSFLAMSAVMIATFSLPRPPPDAARPPSRALSSAGGPTRPRAGVKAKDLLPSSSVPPRNRPGPLLLLLPNVHSGSRRSHQGFAFKRKHRSGTGQHPTHRRHSLLPQFTAGDRGPRHRIKPGDHVAAVEPFSRTHNHPAQRQTAAHTPARDRKQPERRADGRTNVQTKNSRRERLSDGWQAVTSRSERDSGLEKQKELGEELRVGRGPARELGKRGFSDEPSKREAKDLGPSAEGRKASAERETEDGGRCRRFRPRDFPDGDRRTIRRTPDVHWLSDDDLRKMELLAAGDVVSKARVPAHGRVLQIALNHSATQQNTTQTSEDQNTQHAPRQGAAASHGELCGRGSCSLVKRADDWYEVLAFHLDRVLGLNRSLPAVLRTFQSDILPYRYTNGAARPVVWWDPGIKHLDDRDNDQNSVPLSWLQYQEMLKVHCGRKVALDAAPCVGIHHSEWGRLALFDFLLQVNDRLDRCCCGFTPDPTESCVENLLHVKCRNAKELFLVHILVRKAHPSRMVFIDNAGRPTQPTDNLNFRLVEGIEEFPEKAVSVLRSGCLENLLLRSLYVDREFWERQGGASGIRALARTMVQRGRILLRHIRDQRL